MSLDEANTKQNSFKQNISRLRSSIKANQAKLKSHNEKLNAAREKKNQMKEKYLQSQAKVCFNINHRKTCNILHFTFFFSKN